MTTQDHGSDQQDERSPGSTGADQPADDLAASPGADGIQPPPARKPLNLSGWIALVLASVAFAGSLLVAWPQAVLLAALALALSLTGVVRVYRGRATNKAATYTALTLALATIILGFVWADRAQPCIPLSNDTDRFSACYADRTGLL
ncbi:hypothetical protein ABN028_30505 [Actinopolymorpha sp. B17G11]|uniref:hypothetical protein n=1 Tax=unclassified Actinopolymorpha TaxID=2627063 RepID=UPI0032D96408